MLISYTKTHIPFVLVGLMLFMLLPLLPAGLLASDHTGNAAVSLEKVVEKFTAEKNDRSGIYIFEKGEQALLARGWLTDHAAHSIDVQYFIWSKDNIGILAAEALLRAAERGVKVRVLVDDLFIDAPDKIMLALDAHPNVEIRIYNPKHSVGTSSIERFFHVIFNFRSANQRMHDKTFTVDGSVTITGGRNMADEYFDYNTSYNFRDRDVLLLGPVVKEVENNFTTFWDSSFVRPLIQLLGYKREILTTADQKQIYAELHSYAKDPQNFKPNVRVMLENLHTKLPLLAKAMIWDDISFIHDIPGKNNSRGLSGGSETLKQLVQVLSEAKQTVYIQSPYLVMPNGGIEFCKALTDRGVEVKISTNSLASTDNLQAFSGYSKQRKKLLAAGLDVFEFKPNPQIQSALIERYETLEKSVPTFAIHAKTMVIDHEVLYVGTFNLDPRSANLNTEIGVIVRNRELAKKVEDALLRDMSPANSWHTANDKPDRHAPLAKRMKMYFWRMLPLKPLL